MCRSVIANDRNIYVSWRNSSMSNHVAKSKMCLKLQSNENVFKNHTLSFINFKAANADYFRMIEMTRHIHHVFTFWQWFVFVHAYSIIVEYDVRSKYSEEYSTVDKVGSEEILLRMELIPSSFLVWSPSKRELLLFWAFFLLNKLCYHMSQSLISCKWSECSKYPL